MLSTNASQSTTVWNNVQSIVIIALIAFGLVAGAGVVAGQDDPPGEPVNFYGEAEFNDGQPVPNGTTIVAVVDGEVEDMINVTTAGQYGGPDAFDDKLATSTGAGDEVSFRINGPDGAAAIESPVGLEAGGTFQQNLTFDSPPNFELNITDTPAEVTERDEITVEYQVENTGSQSRTQVIEFVVNGTVESTQTVTLNGDELNSDSFNYTTVRGDAPELTTEVRSENDTDTATITVNEAGPPDVTLSNLSIAGGGEDVTVLTEAYDVSVELSYDSGLNGTVPLELSIGDVTASTTVPLNASETKTVTFENATDGLSTGIYDVALSAVNTSITGEVTLSVDVDGNGEPAADTTGDGLLNNVDGDGAFDIFDVQALFDNLESNRVQNNPGLFNFNGNEDPDAVDIFDVQGLFEQLD